MKPRLLKRTILWLGLATVVAAAGSGLAFTVNLVGLNLLRWPAGQSQISLAANLPYQDWLSGARQAAGLWAKAGPAAAKWKIEPTRQQLPLAQDGRCTLALAELDPFRLSRTQVWYRPSSGRIIEVDIRLSSRLAWQVDRQDSAKRPDLVSIMVQELGFGLGLGWGDEGGLAGSWQPGRLGRTIGPQEVKGLNYLYPPSPGLGD